MFSTTSLFARAARFQSAGLAGLLATLLLCAIASASAAAPIQPDGTSWYVSPAGTREGDGSRERPWDLATALSHPPTVRPGDTLWLRGGTYGGSAPARYASRLRGTEQRPITIRQSPGERATINGGILADGEWTWFWGFEITNTDAGRLSNARNRPPGLYLQGRGHRAINLIINNTGHPAIGMWEQVGDGAEVYGCLIWGTGTYDTDRNGRRRGSAIYAQNKDGVRYIRDVISFRNYSTGMKAYTEKAYANGFHFEGNITFDNGDRLLFVSGRDHPAERLKVINNYTYRTPTEDDPPARLGYPDVDQVDAVVTGNFFVNGTHADGAFWSKRFRSMDVIGNTFVSPNMLVTWIRPAALGTYQWDQNRYFGGSAAPFRVDAALCGWSEWKVRTTFDANSAFSAARPQGVNAFLRPNAYEHDRAHLAVYNWEHRESVAVDLSPFLKVGEHYRMVDAQNFWGAPVAEGVYDGNSARVPMKLTAVSAIHGDSLVPNVHTPPEFGAFVIFKTANGRGQPFR